MCKGMRFLVAVLSSTSFLSAHAEEESPSHQAYFSPKDHLAELKALIENEQNGQNEQNKQSEQNDQQNEQKELNEQNKQSEHKELNDQQNEQNKQSEHKELNEQQNGQNKQSEHKELNEQQNEQNKQSVQNDQQSEQKELQNEQNEQKSIQSASRIMSVDIRHSEGGGVGYSQSYTSLDGFFGYDGDNYLPFLDARGHVFNDGKFAANIGIGTRGLFESSCLALGGNIFYDYRNTNRHSYNQIGFGFEVIKPWWEIHVNGYFPVGTKKSRFFNYREQEFLVSGGGPLVGSALPVFDHFAGHELFLLVPGTTSSTFEKIKKKRREFAMAGVDADINVHLVKAANINFEAAAGPYYYRGYYDRQAIGGKARVTARWSDYIAGEFAASYDNIFHGRIHGGLSLIYPFGPKIPKKRENPELNCNSYPDLFYDRLVQRVDRAEIIVVDRKRFTKKETFTVAGTATAGAPAIDPDTGLPWNFIFVRSTDGGGGSFGAEEGTFGISDPGDGTFENPYIFLASAEAPNSVPRDIIYIYAGTGTTAGYNSGFLMQDFQKMWGSGINHNLATTVGTVVVPAQDGTPMLGNGNNAIFPFPAVTLANNNEIAGIIFIDEIITMTTSFLVSGTNINKALIQNNTFELQENATGIFIVNFPEMGMVSLGEIDILSNDFQVVDASMGQARATDIQGGDATVNVKDNTLGSNMGIFNRGFFVKLSGTSGVNISNNVLNDTMNGVQLSAIADGSFVIANITQNMGNANTAYDIETLDSSNMLLTFSGNTMTDPNIGLLLISQDSSHIAAPIISNNAVNNGSSGFTILSNSSSSLSAKLSGNTITNTKIQISIKNESNFSSPHSDALQCTLCKNNMLSVPSGGIGLSCQNFATGTMCLSAFGNTETSSVVGANAYLFKGPLKIDPFPQSSFDASNNFQDPGVVSGTITSGSCGSCP